MTQDISILYDPIENRYRGVYRRGPNWKAIIQTKEVCKYLGTRPTQEQAAKLVIDWYQKMYGHLYLRVLKRAMYKPLLKDDKMGKRNPYEARRGTTGGYTAIVWILGRSVIVTPEKLGGRYYDFFKDGQWTCKEVASQAIKTFCEIFLAAPTDRPLLLRI